MKEANERNPLGEILHGIAEFVREMGDGIERSETIECTHCGERIIIIPPECPDCLRCGAEDARGDQR